MGNIFFLVLTLFQSKKIEDYTNNTYIDQNSIDANIIQRDNLDEIKVQMEESKQPSNNSEDENLIINQNNSSLTSTI